MEFNILSFEENAREKDEFSITRPKGTNNFVFLRVKSKVSLYDKSGMRDYNEGTCILYSPLFKQNYSVSGNDLVHDYVTFTLSNSNFFTEINYPINTAFMPRDSNIIDETIKIINQERHFSPIAYKEMINSAMTKMFIKLARNLDELYQNNQSLNETYDLFVTLKNDIYANPQNYTVSKMAEKVNFSRTYFTAKYKGYFLISPIDDLTKAKMEKIDRVLTAKNTFDISNQFGFDSLSNFYKWFKKNFQCTPKEYLNRKK